MTWQIGIVEVGVIPSLPLSIYAPDAQPDERIDPPCYCYLASNGRSTILVDTGPDRSRSRAAGLEIDGDTHQRLLAGLHEWAIAPGDITAIVHTHLHYDHVQNDLLFPNAAVFVQRRELDWAMSADSGQFYVGVPELIAALGDRLHLLDGDSEVLKGVTGVLNGGHTPGHQSVVVDTTAGDVCLCGDIVSMYSNIDTPGSVCPNLDETDTFLRRARTEAWEMIPSHDPVLREHRWFVRTSTGDSIEAPPG